MTGERDSGSGERRPGRRLFPSLSLDFMLTLILPQPLVLPHVMPLRRVEGSRSRLEARSSKVGRRRSERDASRGGADHSGSCVGVRPSKVERCPGATPSTAVGLAVAVVRRHAARHAPDAGSRPVDAGSRPIDSRARPVGSGSRPIDSGSRPVDSASRPVDSGSSPTDSGSHPTDSRSSATDSGSNAADCTSSRRECRCPRAPLAMGISHSASQSSRSARAPQARLRRRRCAAVASLAARAREA